MDKPRFEIAPTVKIGQHPEIVEDLIRRVFEFEPGDYAISDESLLSDMTDEWPGGHIELIKRLYGIDLSQRHQQPYIWELAAEIAQRRNT